MGRRSNYFFQIAIDGLSSVWQAQNFGSAKSSDLVVSNFPMTVYIVLNTIMLRNVIVCLISAVYLYIWFSSLRVYLFIKTVYITILFMDSIFAEYLFFDQWSWVLNWIVNNFPNNQTSNGLKESSKLNPYYRR